MCCGAALTLLVHWGHNNRPCSLIPKHIVSFVLCEIAFGWVSSIALFGSANPKALSCSLQSTARIWIMIRIRTMIRVVSKHRTKSLPPRIIESNAIEIPLETRSVPLAQALEGGHHGGTIRPRKDGSIHADADKPTAIGSAFAIDSVAASALHCQCFRRRGGGLAVVEWSCFSCKFGIGTIIVFHNDIVGASHQELHQHGQHSGPAGDSCCVWFYIHHSKGENEWERDCTR